MYTNSNYKIYSPTQPSKNQLGLVGATCLALMVAGTGGMHSVEGQANPFAQKWGFHRLLNIQGIASPQEKQATQVKTISEQLLNIRESFALSVAGLASIFQVTRPTIYSWLDNQNLKPDAYQKIEKLNKLAESFSALSLDRPDLLVNRPLFEGKSLVDLLRNGENLSEAFDTIKILANKEAIQRKEIKSSGKTINEAGEALDRATPIMIG